MDINDIIGEIIDINDTTDRLIAYTTMIMHLRNLREQIGFNDIRDAVIHGDKLTKINKLLLEKFISIIDENVQSIRKAIEFETIPKQKEEPKPLFKEPIKILNQPKKTNHDNWNWGNKGKR